MIQQQKVLFVDASTSYYKIKKYDISEYFGPVDLGLHLSGRYKTLNFGVGLLAGSIIPGSNRLIVTGFSPCWGGFYISSMGGAGLVFDHLGINMLSLTGKSSQPSILYLNRQHGEEIEVELVPIDIHNIWNQGEKGFYSLMQYTYEQFSSKYDNDPRILATGPASYASDIGAIGSAPIVNGKVTNVDTWAGRGGFGSRLLQDHGIAAIIYGGTYIDEDFRDRKVADEWFVQRYNKILAVKDFEATTKYRFDPKFDTGGTLGVNYASNAGTMFSFNYQSMYWTEEERKDWHEKMIAQHYLIQFNNDTIKQKNQSNCGEPCSAVCKKMRDKYKKDYEPYQVMGPLSGIFDQNAAELLNHHADMYGFDAISVGGVIAWLMECLDKGVLTKEELAVSKMPVFKREGFRIVEDSMHNAELGIELLDAMIQGKGLLNMKEGARKMSRNMARLKGRDVIDMFVYTAFGRNGWMVPNQYWTPGALSPMAIMGKYYMYYGADFIEPRILGQVNAERFKQELIMDNMGICRFHRAWAEEMLPEIVESLFGLKEYFIRKTENTACRINSRNASIFWESQRNIDFIHTWLKRVKEQMNGENVDLDKWIKRFNESGKEAALHFWYEIHKGIHEKLLEF